MLQSSSSLNLGGRSQEEAADCLLILMGKESLPLLMGTDLLMQTTERRIYDTVYSRL